MKKLTNILLTFLMAASLSACGGNGDTGNSNHDYSNDEDNPVLVEDEFDKDGKLIISYFAIDLDSLQSQTDDTKKLLNILKINSKLNLNF